MNTKETVESNDRESSDDNTEDQCEEVIYKDNVEESAKNRTKNEAFEHVEISDSEENQILDPDYLCDEEPVSDTSTQPYTSIASSSLTKECEELLTEVIDPSTVSGRHIDWGASKTWLLRNAPYISFQSKTWFATLE